MILEAERGNWAAALPALSVVMAAGDADDETGMLLSRQKAALSYLEALDDSAGSDRSLRPRARIGKAQDAMAALPGFWPAALLLADLHEQAGSSKKAVKPLETAFRNMPHESLAMRLRTLWGVNEGTAAGRLMRLIPCLLYTSDAADD